MKSILHSINISFFVIIAVSQTVLAQDSPMAQVRHKPITTMLLPLYLDSAFKDGKYAHGNNMPTFLLPGLEFYNGVKIAAEELKEQGIPAQIKIIDSKSAGFLYKLFKDSAYQKPGLVISMAQTSTELKSIAEPMKKANWPLISLLPNDAGITDYPNMMVANSTISTHITALYKYLQRNHSIDNVIMLTPIGNSEDKIKELLLKENKNASGIPLSWRDVRMSENFSTEQCIALLDSNRQNIILATTLSASRAQKIVRTLASVGPAYKISVYGMPTWETVSFSKTEFEGVDIYYGTPFIGSSTQNIDLNLNFVLKYRELTNSRPSDMAYRGYEITLRFAKILARYGETFMQHINDDGFSLFTEFNFQPVGDRNTYKADYQENTKIYFLKKTDNQSNEDPFPKP